MCSISSASYKSFLVPNYEDDVIVFDTETSGLDVKLHDILSIAWLKFNIVDNKFHIIERKHFFIKNANITNTSKAFNFNHITDAQRNVEGVDISYVLSEFKLAIKNNIVCAYNVSFDVNFVKKYDPNAFADVKSIMDIMC